MKKKISQTKTAWSLVENEVSIMKMLDHKNIVQLKEVIDDPDNDYICIVMEYCQETINKALS